MTTARHLILRAGAIGLATFDALRRRGETVRLITRSGRARGAPTTSRSPGATPATPPAPQRERLIPRPAGAALASVEATAARLVSMDNVSLYRRARRHPHTESRAYDAPHHQRATPVRMARTHRRPPGQRPPRAIGPRVTTTYSERAQPGAAAFLAG
jgi:hypothetical protein